SCGVIGTPPNHPPLGPASENGANIFYGYDNTANVGGDLGLRSIQFNGTVFGTQNSRNLGRQPTAGTNPAAISPASNLFFGVNSDHTFFRHATDLSPITWAISGLGATQNIFTQPTVSGNFMFAMSNTLTRFRLATAATGFAYGAGLPQVPPPALGTTTYFVSDQLNRQMVALNVVIPPTTRWAYSGDLATTPSTRLTSV